VRAANRNLDPVSIPLALLLRLEVDQISGIPHKGIESLALSENCSILALNSRVAGQKNKPCAPILDSNPVPRFPPGGCARRSLGDVYAKLWLVHTHVQTEGLPLPATALR